MEISEIDRNFKPEQLPSGQKAVFVNAAGAPFSLHGIMPPDEKENYYRRIPTELAEKVNDGVRSLFTNTAGGRIRFRSDTGFVALRVKRENVCVMNHMALTGIGGFSLYEGESGSEVFVSSFMPLTDKEYTAVVTLSDRKMRELTLYMPLYNNVDSLLIGVDENAELLPAGDYKIGVPVVFYGSSITQGGCASRPGTDYQGFLSRALGCDYLNLGFSGSARGEQVMAEYICRLEMSAFVLDYDHNAPTAEHLEATHEAFFKTVRAAQPELPIIVISRPKLLLNDDEKRRRDIIRRTFDNARGAGDENVYFIDGSTFFADSAFNDPTVDNCHPTDLGFYFMARGIEPVLRACLKI